MELKYDYTKFFLKDIIADNKFKIPQFQRNVVWNKQKRIAFVKNLRDGNPFGSILVYQDSDNNYSLIDGLQRISTIKDFINNPFKYIDYNDVNSDYIINILKRDYEIRNIHFDVDSNLKKIEEIKKFIFESIKKGADATSIKFKLYEKYGFCNDETIERNIMSLVNDLMAQKNVDNLMVPTIIYNGSREELPNIFYNLNTGGINLSKYETFSSLWDQKKYKIKDEDILNKISEKYENLRQKSDLEVEVNFEDIEDNGVTLFEYCYSISEILRDPEKDYQCIIGKNKKSTDPMGFELLTLVTGMPVNKAENLDTKLGGASPEFLVKLKDAIVSTFDVMVDSLKPWVLAKNGTYNTFDGTYMIYHMFMSYIKHNYEINFNNYTIKKNEGVASWNDGFKKNLHLHYIKDVISDFWKINRQVADLTREIENESHCNKYSKTISANDWDEAFRYFRDDQLDNSTSTISLKTKLFLDYLVKFKINEDRNLDKYFNPDYFSKDKIKIDYEHIVPQKILLDNLGKNRFRNFQVSCVGNMCYLASKDNRSKHDNTIYRDAKIRPSFVTNNEYLDLIDYPLENELNFINYSPEEFEKSYKSFITSRLDHIIEEFKNYVK